MSAGENTADSVQSVPPPGAPDDASQGENTDDADASVRLVPDEFAAGRPRRKRRKPGDADAAFRQMVFARRASEDARRALLDRSCISRTRRRVEPPYPEALVGTFNCACRARFSAGAAYVEGADILASPLPAGSRVYHLRGHHWVSLTRAWYTDDADRFAVLDFDGARRVLASF